MNSTRMVGVVLILATGLVGCDADEDSQEAPLTLSTGDWTPADGEVGGVVGGVLHVNKEGCLYVPGPGGGLDIMWPAGFISVTGDGGTVKVLDAEGRTVAMAGKPFAAKGQVSQDNDVTSQLSCQANPGGVVIIISSQLPPLDDWYTPDSHVVTLYHCGVNPTQFEGSRWVVPHALVPFDGGNAPQSFVGRGTMVRLASHKARYTDESGVELTFVPAGSQPSMLCA